MAKKMPLIDTKRSNHGGMAKYHVAQAPHNTGNGDGPANPANKATMTSASEGSYGGGNRGKAMYPSGHSGKVGN